MDGAGTLAPPRLLAMGWLEGAALKAVAKLSRGKRLSQSGERLLALGHRLKSNLQSTVTTSWKADECLCCEVLPDHSDLGKEICWEG